MKNTLLKFLYCLGCLPVMALAAESKSSLAVQDRFQALQPGSVQLEGFINGRIEQQTKLSFDPKTLAAMADIFRKRANGFANGEYWGKAVRALGHLCQYRRDPELIAMLRQTADDLVSAQTADGCISAFGYKHQPKSSDLWDRKYAMLGLLGSYEVTGDPKLLEATVRLADYILGQVGPPPKTRIVDTGWAFQGIESSSILEPMVKLYRLTGHERYLEFARYIVEVEGACKRENIFEAAFNGKDVKDFGNNGNPRQSIAKAYESQSCFEGLVEYYRATGNERWKQAALNFYSNVLAKETTVIGSSCGLGPLNKGPAATEQWNYAAFYQTCPVIEGGEGCQTARWMAFCRQLLLLTGESRFADQFELAMYNALLGSIKPSGEAVDYHTHLNGARPGRNNFAKLFNGRYFTCCYYNIMDTLMLIPSVSVMSGEGGPVVNLYIPGTARVKLADGNEVAIKQATDYPQTGAVTITVNPRKSARFPVRLRIPEWSKDTVVKVNGKTVAAQSGRYLCVERKWTAGDTIALTLDMRGRLVRPPEGTPENAKAFQALIRGPLVLARDRRLGGNVYEGGDIATGPSGYVNLTPMAKTLPALVQFSVPTVGGESFPVIDFATSGNTWDRQSEHVTWIPSAGNYIPCGMHWIGFPDSDKPAKRAPVGKCWFRCVVDIPDVWRVGKAMATLCADKQFRFFVNGREVGSGSDWRKPVTMNITTNIKSGPVVFAVEAENQGDSPNGVALLGRIYIAFGGASPLFFSTDWTWKTSNQETAGWKELGFNDETWKPAKLLGRNGMSPWGLVKGLYE